MTDDIEKGQKEPIPPEKEAPTDTDPAADGAAPQEPKDAKSDKKKDKAELISLREQNAALTGRLAAAEAALAEQKDQLLRVAAEYDNFRRRTQKERDALYTDAAFDVLADVLPTVDNLERAALATGDAEAIRRGLEMTLTAIRELLKKQGVEAYGEPGETFDPALHHAVMHEDDPDRSEGEITQVFMRGYKKGERVLRYAMVKVAN
ncbi:MAG: nucleotide exchange factor GrpE [Clostridia bacterium]|nr:nucleotide exchange factor GrpE [Clostridia bacterium]